MFHEVAHGLGIKYLVNDPKTEVSDAMMDMDVALEEGKAADFVMLTQDIMKIEASEILSTFVVQTYLDGDMVYNAE